MKKRISTMIAVTFLIFAAVSAQQRNEQHSSRIGDSLIASDGRPSRTNKQAIVYPRGKLYGLRTHRFNRAHFVNGSNINGAYVKVYGEANPSKTDEHLLDIETRTQLLRVRSSIASSESSGGSGHELSLSGYGPPGGEPEVPEKAGTDEQAEAARPNVENPYDSIPAATEAEQQAMTAEISSTSSAKEESGVPSVTDTEQAIIPSEATTSAVESREELRETEESRTESAVSATESEVGSEASTEGSIATETVTEPSEVSIISSTNGISTEQFESTSIGTEAVGISTTEGIKIDDKSRFEGYGAGDESERTEGIPETEVQETEGGGIEFTTTESAAESSIGDVITQTEPVKVETGAEDLGYGVPPKTLEEQPSTEETPSSIAQTLPEVEATATSGAEEITSGATTLPTIGEESRYTETETTSFETEISSSSSQILTEETEGISPPVIEPAGGVPGYETLSEPGIGKEGLAGLDEESKPQLAKSTAEATTLSEEAEKTEITSEKPSEDRVTEPDLKDSTELVTSSAEVSETTGFLKEESLPHAEQPSGYGEIASEYTTGHTEVTELQKISEGTEAPVETSPTEAKAASDETPAISTEVFMVSGSAENGATELPSESKEDATALEGIVSVEETPKSGEGLAGYGEIISTPESVAETAELEKLDEKLTVALESSETPPILPTGSYETTLQTKFTKTEAGEQPSSMEILTESGITDTEILERTTQPLGYGEPLVVPDSPHESITETERIESSLTEKTSDESIEETTPPLSSSQDLATSEAIITTGKVAEETESESTIRTEYTDTQTGAEDIGYGGGGEEAVTEKEQIGDTSIIDTSVPKSDLESTTLSEEVLISSTAVGAEETKESPILSTELHESTEGVVESTEQFTNGEVETSEKIPGYDIYPATEATKNELPPSDEKLTVEEEIGESTPEVSEIASASEGTVSLSSSASESAESIVTSHAISEGTEYTEMPVSETASVQIESSEIPTDKHDFGYGGKLEELTEKQLIAETQESETSIAVTEPIVTTEEQIIVEKTAESSQQPSATETLSAESSVTISSETTDSATEGKTSLQYPEGTTLLQRLPELSELPKSDVEDTATPPSIEGIEIVGTSDAAESTLMHVVTSEVEIPVPYGEEAPQVIAMTKIMKTGPSAITASETLTTVGAKEEVESTGAETTEKSSLETVQEFEAKTTKSEETSEIRSELDTISSETVLITSPEELVTNAVGISETESSAKSNGDISAKIPMGPADFGYGGEIEHSSSILPGIESVTTMISELPLSNEQHNHIETSAAPESIVTAEYSSTEIFSESASKSSEEYASATFPSVLSEALTESVTQTMLATQEESIASEDIHDQSDTPSKIPTGPADFGYGDSVQEESNVASNPRAYSNAIIASNKGIIFENQEQTRQKHFDGSVVSNTATKPLGKTGNSSRRKWKPFTIDCKQEVDEKGDLCQEWARAGLCATHRPTMFLFCRRTCLCIGPPMDLIR